MNILVLGGKGQIGEPFMEYARQQKHTVTCLDKKLGPEYDLADVHNFTSDAAVYRAFSRADVVVFLAFNVGGSKYMAQYDKSLEYISENVQIMNNVFGLLNYFLKPFLFASSQMSNMFHTNYGFLKNLGERYTRTLPLGCICRFWNVFGQEDPNDLKSHVITDFIHMAKQDGVIKMRTDGTEERQFLYVDDASRALLHWCENYDQYDHQKYIDITSFEWVSVLQVARIIQEFTSCTIEIGDKKDTFQGGIRNVPSEYILQFWHPQISLRDGIKKLL